MGRESVAENKCTFRTLLTLAACGDGMLSNDLISAARWSKIALLMLMDTTCTGRILIRARDVNARRLMNLSGVSPSNLNWWGVDCSGHDFFM